ncbi:hypothetical protein HZS_6287 [Henneguya salminicola]|nr:hypothetical protein HZS_6287 [Henneguya salminicola]
MTSPLQLGTTESEKEHELSLDQDTASRLIYIIQNLPATGLYDKLETRLLYAYCLSKRTSASRLLKIDGLGNRMPS